MRTFLALIRRECQERRGLFIAIGVFAGLALGATILAGSNLMEPGVLDLGNVGTISGAPYFLLAFVLTFFYLTGALHGERRDRSVYFWKSMPVGDATTVAAKLVVGVLLIPGVCLAAMAVNHLVVLVWAPWDVWRTAQFPELWVHGIVGVIVYVFWGLPVWGWLLLTSAVAPRLPMLLALSPLLLFIFREIPLLRVLSDFILAHARRIPLPGTAYDISESLALFASLEMFIGIAVGAACLAGAILARRVLNET